MYESLAIGLGIALWLRACHKSKRPNKTDIIWMPNAGIRIKKYSDSDIHGEDYWSPGDPPVIIGEGDERVTSLN